MSLWSYWDSPHRTGSSRPNPQGTASTHLRTQNTFTHVHRSSPACRWIQSRASAIPSPADTSLTESHSEFLLHCSPVLFALCISDIDGMRKTGHGCQGEKARGEICKEKHTHICWAEILPCARSVLSTLPTYAPPAGYHTPPFTKERRRLRIICSESRHTSNE